MFMVTNDENADPQKGYIGRGNMNDLQVWVVETLLNEEPELAPYMALMSLTAIAGLIGEGYPVDEDLLRMSIDNAVEITKKVRDEEGGPE